MEAGRIAAERLAAMDASPDAEATLAQAIGRYFDTHTDNHAGVCAAETLLRLLLVVRTGRGSSLCLICTGRDVLCVRMVLHWLAGAVSVCGSHAQASDYLMYGAALASRCCLCTLFMAALPWP